MIVPEQLTVEATGPDRISILNQTDEKAAKYFGGLVHHRVYAKVTEEAPTIGGVSFLFKAEVTYEGTREESRLS